MFFGVSRIFSPINLFHGPGRNGWLNSGIPGIRETQGKKNLAFKGLHFGGIFIGLMVVAKQVKDAMDREMSPMGFCIRVLSLRFLNDKRCAYDDVS